MTIDGWVKLAAPAWLWGGNAIGMIEAAGMRSRKVPGNPEMLMVRTEESYFRRRADLVRLLAAGGPGASPDGMALLESMSVAEVDPETSNIVDAFVKRLATDEHPDLVKMAVFYQVVCSSVPLHHLPEQAASVLGELRALPMEGSGEPAFPNAGVYALRRSDVLSYRLKLIAVLLRVEHDARLASGDASGLVAAHEAGDLTFAAGESLHSGSYLMEAYIGVLLGALTPGVWGFAAFRGRGPVVFSFGQQVAGSTSEAPELLRTLPTEGADRVTKFERLPKTAVPAALTWWAYALNELFGVVTDWEVFADDDGVYQPSVHLQVISTIEQLFRRVLSVQANHDDLHARRVVFFSVLDTLESLTGQPIELQCDVDFASKRLDDLRAAIPSDAATVLLPSAARAVSALNEVQNGFFIREPDGQIMLEPSRGRRVTPAKASAQYLKLLRNATHGHGTNRPRQVEMTETLLARHNGRVPHDVALLSWLYVLTLLARPAALRRHLKTQSQQAGRLRRSGHA